MQKPLIFKKLAAAALALATAALAAGTPAGTVIENIASIVYTPANGPEVTTPSTPTTTVVNAVCSPSVLPNGTVAAPGQSANLLPGDTTLFRYTLNNAGNTNTTFNLSGVTDAASAFTPAGVTVYHDLNGNGTIDISDTAIGQITLAPDASASLLLKVDTTNSSRGSAYVNLIAACSGNANERDDNNISKITLGEPSAFTINKTFTPDNVKPGAETSVSIYAGNVGGASRGVTITDFLNTPAMRDFVFVSGSARATGSATGIVEYSVDGNIWSSAEPATVAAVRVRTDMVASGGTLGLTFRLRAPEADLGTRRNIAQLISDTQTLDAPADVTVKYNPVIALGPINNPEANPGGEMSSDDRQVKDNALLNQEICFAHTIKNLGERDDAITTTGTVNTGAATIVLRDMNGDEINSPFTVTLAAGATTNFQACYTPTQVGGPTEALKVTLTSTSSRGAASNSTVDIVNNIVENKIQPVKTGDKGSKLVSPGEEINYTLTFTNNQTFALTNTVLRDDLNVILRTCLAPTSLPTGTMGAQNTTTLSTSSTSGTMTKQDGLFSALEFVSADQGGVLEGTVVVWRLGTVQPGQTVTVHLKVKVPTSTPDCANIINTFTVSSDQIGTPVPSKPVTNVVYDPNNLKFNKSSNPSTVVLGEEITYILRVTNGSATMPLTDIQVKDTMPVGLEYVEGSSTLDGAPITPTIDPENSRTYIWKIPGLATGVSAEIRFRATVSPDAPNQLTNNALATAVASGRLTQSPTSVASNKILPLSFGPNNADIVGYVFQDVNRNGIYDYGKDIPCENARVILSNGRIVLTDKEGRYHFRNVREGEWALRLDPNSVSAQNLSMPMDAGREGSRLTYVRNLTSIDFPLAPDAGDIAVIRDTTLRIKGGPVDAQNTLTVRKQVFSTTKDTTLYTVQLTLSASAPLNAFTLTDPLPAGATLVLGQNTATIDPLPSGERMITYSFRYTGDVKGAVTDPTASWRY